MTSSLQAAAAEPGLIDEDLGDTGLGVPELVHDLRQELAVLRHLVDRLSRPGTTGAELPFLLDGLRTQLEAVDRLVLSVDRPRSAEPVDLARLAGEVVAAAARLHPRVELRAEPVPDVLADEVLLRRAVLNLVVNAVDAAPDGRVVVTVGAAAGQVCLQVEDDGRGGDPDADRLGLGTWVVHAVVRDGGGTVERRTAPHGGRVVDVRLAATGEQAPP